MYKIDIKVKDETLVEICFKRNIKNIGIDFLFLIEKITNKMTENELSLETFL